jgi:hypothetical protein
VRFFVGLHHPSDARHFGAAFISVNALRARKSFPGVSDWILDSGAFTEISRHGGYRHGVEAYADEIVRWSSSGRLLAAACQDFMCEPHIIAKTGLSVERHQELTIERYDALRAALADRGCSVPVLPVLQGYKPEEYERHVAMYGARLAPDAWVGVGSVCKRNGSVSAILDVLYAVRDAAPWFRLHGFGLKTNALRCAVIRCCLLATADSMAWSFQARRQGRNANDPREARRWARRFGFDSDGNPRETWRTIGINEADDWQTPPELVGAPEAPERFPRRARKPPAAPQLSFPEVA